MSSDNPTSIIKFGEKAPSGFAVVEIDAREMEINGSLPNHYPPGTEVLVLVHHAKTTEIRATSETGNGLLELIGTVRREKEQELSFAPDVTELDLTHIPIGLVSVQAQGKVTSLEASGDSRQIVASAVPALVKVKYSYEARQYRYITPKVKGELPVNLYFETEENNG